MAGEFEECITLKAESLPTGSISFGRFELESLSWERRSSFSHNRYLEEVEKYSTPGSVTKKKEYFEAHFKKKALLRQVPEESQNEAESRHARSIIDDNYSIIEDFKDRGNSETIEFSWDDGYDPSSVVPDENEVIELQKEKMSTTEFITEFSSFNNEEFGEPFNEPLNLDGALQSKYEDNGMRLDEDGLWASLQEKTLNNNANLKEQAENRDGSSKTCKKKNEFVQMKTKNVSEKSTVELKVGRSQFSAYLPAKQISKKPLINSSFVTYGTLKKVEKQNASAEVENRITPKVPSPSIKNENLKIKASLNMKAKASPEIKSEEGVRAKKGEANRHAVDRLGSDMRQPVYRPVDRMTWVKLVSKADDKQNPVAFKFKSSERAEKRKEYNLKLEKRLHAKVAEMNEIQAKTEVVKEAEIKQLRKSLNFKATPMPSFYHETTPRVSDLKKASTTPTKSQEKSIPSPPSNQDCEEHSSNRTTSPSIPSSAIDRSSSSANRKGNSEGVDTWKGKNSGSLSQGNGMGRKGDRKNRIRTGVRGGIVESVAVHVAS